MAAVETFAFQAETKALLDLMIHSLYTNKEIFLRELISNASDALDRLRFESLTNPDILADGGALEIWLQPDAEAHNLTIRDTGIGMSRDEVIRNIGTIARSGTGEARKQWQEAQSAESVAEMIGQFGVGFYSAFMVADRVTLITRRAGETAGTKWESTGDGAYTLTEVPEAPRGTSVILHLKTADREEGLEDFANTWVLSEIVKRHSDFIAYPIILPETRKDDKSGETTIENKTLNSMKPLWTRPSSEVTEEEYNEFYKHLTHDFNPPLKTLSFKAEGIQEYQSLIFLPSKAPFDLYYHESESQMRLYARRVLIMDRTADLLPRYLRFVRGVVDASSLPLNISRQHVQQDRHVTQIRKWLTRKLLDTFAQMQTKEPDQYKTLWEEFGKALKEGATDYENQSKLLPLYLFSSSHDPEKLVTLQQYVDRMQTGQDEILYLTGRSRSAVEQSPHLESVLSKGYEVLYLTDPVDELVVQSVPEFSGKRLKSVGKGAVQVGSGEERVKVEAELKARSAEFTPLLEYLQHELDSNIKQVRLSARLTKSPSCLVVEEYEYSPQLERLLMKGEGGGPRQKRIMELNPDHLVVQRLRERLEKDSADPLLPVSAQFLYGMALLAEGSELPEPAKFMQAASGLFEKAV